jgi:hypothetical protein
MFCFSSAFVVFKRQDALTLARGDTSHKLTLPSSSGEAPQTTLLPLPPHLQGFECRLALDTSAHSMLWTSSAPLSRAAVFSNAKKKESIQCVAERVQILPLKTLYESCPMSRCTSCVPRSCLSLSFVFSSEVRHLVLLRRVAAIEGCPPSFLSCHTPLFSLVSFSFLHSNHILHSPSMSARLFLLLKVVAAFCCCRCSPERRWSKGKLEEEGREGRNKGARRKRMIIIEKKQRRELTSTTAAHKRHEKQWKKKKKTEDERTMSMRRHATGSEGETEPKRERRRRKLR